MVNPPELASLRRNFDVRSSIVLTGFEKVGPKLYSTHLIWSKSSIDPSTHTDHSHQLVLKYLNFWSIVRDGSGFILPSTPGSWAMMSLFPFKIHEILESDYSRIATRATKRWYGSNTVLYCSLEATWNPGA